MDNVNLSDDVNQQPGAVGGKNNAGALTTRGKTFANGDVIVTLLPVNEKFPWVTPARFRPELVPEELMAPVLTVSVDFKLRKGPAVILDKRH